MNTPSTPRPALLGIAWMVFGMSCIGMIDGMAKYLTRHLTGIQVAWGYFLATLACLLVFAAATATPPRALVRTRRPLLQVGRAAALVLSLAFLFGSMQFLPLAVATTMSFTAPLIIVALSGPMLRERVGLGRWLAVGAGMLGALIVVRPGSAVFQWATLLPVGGALFFSQFHIATRVLGAFDRPLTTVFWTFAIGSALACVPMPLVWRAPSPGEWGLLAASGVLGFAAHFAIARAMTYADASTVAPLNYVRLVWAISIGYVVFGNVPDAATLVGGAIIVGSGLYVVYGERAPAPARCPGPGGGGILARPASREPPRP